MYDLPPYKDGDRSHVIAFARAHPFALIAATSAEGQPVATQVPLFFDERDNKLYLHGHIMRKTDHHKAMEQNPKVLAVFTGANSYVSASWYTNKQVGSTWNYMSVHAKGLIRFLSTEELVGILRRTTNHFENNPHSGANFEDLPDSYVHPLLRAIVGFEIEVTDLQHVFKLSQDKNESSYENVVGHLHAQGDDGKELAEEMKKRQHDVFVPGHKVED